MRRFLFLFIDHTRTSFKKLLSHTKYFFYPFAENETVFINGCLMPSVEDLLTAIVSGGKGKSSKRVAQALIQVNLVGSKIAAARVLFNCAS